MIKEKLAKEICQASAKPIREQLAKTAWEQVGYFCIKRCGKVPDANETCWEEANHIHKKILALLFEEYARQN